MYGKINQQKKELQNNLNTKRKQFINSLTILINACYFKNKDSNLMLEIKENFIVYKKIAEDIIITKTGEYIWKYKEQIKAGDDFFFINNSFDNDITEFYQKNPNEKRFNKNDVDEIFSLLKTTYPKLNEGEKKTIWTHTKNLLKYYAEYKLCKQRISEINKNSM